MEQKFRTQYIQRLDIKERTLNILNSKNIKTLEELCNISKNELLKMEIPKIEIEKIEEELQLLGGNIKG